jgi:threonyl-tRNA synthetase
MRSVGSDLELDARPVVRVDEAFHDAHPDVVADVVSALDGAVPIEVRAGPGTRLVVELGAVDGGRFRPVAEVSVDPAGAGRFGIELADGGTPAVVSLAPVGDAERTMATLLAAESDRERPHLPAWLSPTQVRLIPVAGNHLDCCERVAATLPPSVRVDVDDRELPVGERIDRATEAWVPYVAVVGDRERDGSALDVSVRASGRQRRLSPDELAAEVAAAVGDRPSLPRSLPRHVGDRLDAVRE